MMMGAKSMMHSTMKNIIVGDVMGKYCEKSGMKCIVNSVFTCKIAKKNHHFITFGLKVVLLQTKKNHRKLKELMELKKLKTNVSPLLI